MIAKTDDDVGDYVDLMETTASTFPKEKPIKSHYENFLIRHGHFPTR